MIIAFSSVLVVQGLEFMEFGRFQQLPVMGISKNWIYAAMPVGGAADDRLQPAEPVARRAGTPAPAAAA